LFCLAFVVSEFCSLKTAGFFLQADDAQAKYPTAVEHHASPDRLGFQQFIGFAHAAILLGMGITTGHQR